MMIPFTIHT